jgi:hypothetical protein
MQSRSCRTKRATRKSEGWQSETLIQWCVAWSKCTHAPIPCSDGNADLQWDVHRDMLDADEPNLPLAVALLQGVKHNSAADRLLRILTDESVVVYDEFTLSTAVLRARHNSAQYPLLRLEIDKEFCTSPELLSVLGLTTTLTALTFEAFLASEIVSAAAPLLKAIPSLREVELDRFAGDLALEVLRTRTNWSCIHLPREASDLAKTSAFAALNQTDFALRLHVAQITPEHLNQWLANPHLTALESLDGIPPAQCLAALQSCRSLTHLVAGSRELSCDRLLRACVCLRVCVFVLVSDTARRS